MIELLELLDPIDGDECSDEAAFRALAQLKRDLGWVADEIPRLAGFLRVAPVTFLGNRRFDVGVQGADSELSVLVGGLGERESLVDGVAWPVDRPDRWATYGGRLPALGLAALLEHPEMPDAPSLRVYRDPWAWLSAGGDGIAPLDLAATAVEIRGAIERGGRIKPGDDVHAAEIAGPLAALTDLRLLVVDDRVAA